MSCFLRVGGADLAVDALLQNTGMVPERVWHKGDIRTSRSKPLAHSEAVFVVSKADLNEFEQQLNDATHYLELHSTAIKQLVASPGVKWAVLDFGIETRGEGHPHNDLLPSRFIRAAGITGIDVELSHYSSNEEEES